MLAGRELYPIDINLTAPDLRNEHPNVAPGRPVIPTTWLIYRPSTEIALNAACVVMTALNCSTGSCTTVPRIIEGDTKVVEPDMYTIQPVPIVIGTTPQL